MRFKVSKPGCGVFKVLGEFDDFALAVLFKATYNQTYLAHAEVFDSSVSMDEPVITDYAERRLDKE